MKAILATVVILFSMNVFAISTYECVGLAGVEEYRVEIDQEKRSANFFDNDTNSSLKQTGMYMYETYPTQLVYEFTGQDMSQEGDLFLEFNFTTKTAYLYSFNTKESKSLSLIGSAKCKLFLPTDMK